MKTTYRFLAISLLIVACAPNIPVYKVDPAFQSYVNDFESEFGDIGKTVVRFGKPRSSTELVGMEVAAECEPESYFNYAVPVVTVNERAWNLLPTRFKKKLIYHELGHCVLHLNHSLRGFMAPRIDTDD